MSDKKTDDKIIKDIDEAEAVAYKQIFGIFDIDSGDFLKADIQENIRNKGLAKGRTIKHDEKTGELKASLRGKPVEEWDKQELLQYTVETDLILHGSIQQDTINLLDKEGYYFSDGSVYKNEDVKLNGETEKSGQKPETENEIDRFIKELSEKEISSMVITIKINGIVEEYVNDEKAGEKYLSKDAQIEKIKETVNGFKNIVIVHSEEELKKLQEDFIKKQEKKKESEIKSIDNKGNKQMKESKVKTQVYIRISEDDYEMVRSLIEKENINIMANKVKARDDKSGVNMIIQFVDADKVRSILKQNNVPILQDVDGNIDWDDIKERSNKFENVTVEQLREFQSKNNDKFDYVAFRKDDGYTIFADKKCNIAIGASGRKTLKQLEAKVEEHKKISPTKKGNKEKVKTNNSKEAER